MRKLVSVSIVGVMVLTLVIGLLGGVVDEGDADAIYDPNNNTIYLTGLHQLETVLSDPDTDSVFWYNSTSFSYVTIANIQINQSASLTIDAGEILKFDFSLEMTVLGRLFVNGIEGNMATITSNRTTPAKGDWQGIVFNTIESTESNVNYLNLSYAEVGIFCDGSSPVIQNSIISNCSDDGIFCNTASPLIDNNQISYNGNGDITDSGIYLISSSPIVENTTFTFNPDRDFLLSSDSHPISLNSSFGLVIFLDSFSNLTVKWYLEVYAEDNITDLPIQGATVWVRDNDGNSVEGSPFTTNSQGTVKWIQVVDKVLSLSGPTPFTPHNITVSHDEYYTGYAEPTMDSSKRIQINLTMLHRDLTATPSDITFLPPGIPIAGDNLTVYAMIYNVEVDDAQNVRVKIFDDAPEGNYELFHVILPEIKGNNSEEVSKRWKPTPGTHVIYVYIDPDNEIKEINSTTGEVGAENNNNITISINVNAKPEVNITEPEENDEINGTSFINGTALDDPRDDTWDPLNNITRVDIKLDDYDWIQLLPGPNLIYNELFDIWNWQYLWDTTQWNGTPVTDGNYTLYARSWDNYHFSDIDSVNIAINNTGANTPPNASISSPTEPNEFNVSQVITFDGRESTDEETPQNLNFSWDFDDTVDSNIDGNFTNDKDAFGNITTHAYGEIGVFVVWLNVTDEQGLSDFDNVTIWITNHLPVVNMTASDTQPYEEDVVHFNGSGSYDPDGTIENYTWDFNDSTPFEYDPDVNHTFTEAGTFNVTLTVTDNTGAYNTTWIAIEVLANDQPNADISNPAPFDDFNVNETIFFSGSDSSDQNDEFLEYFWDFGDGNTYLENASYYPDGEYDGNTTHHYTEVGDGVLETYTVTLEVRDDDEGNDTTLLTIIVDNYPPNANATSNVTTAPTNQNILFDGSNSDDADDTTLTFLWDFGDGDTSTFEITVHEFTQEGIYNVTLNVSDDNAYDIDWIIVNITNRAPIIEEVIVSPDSPKVHEVIDIEITASDDDGEIVNYSWDFDGDGEYDYYETQTNAPDGTFDGITTHSYPMKTEYGVIITVEDDDGNITITQILIIIANTPPEISITSPQDGAPERGVINIEGTSFDLDDYVVTRVEIKIGDFEWIEATDTSSNNSFYEWEYSWDTENDDYKVPNGTYTILARAYDSDSTSDPPASISVYVDNQATSILITLNVNRTTVTAGDSIMVWGKVTYNTGGAVDDIDVNITILGDFWLAPTSSSGDYQANIIAPDQEGNYLLWAIAEKDPYDDASESVLIDITAPPQKPDLTVSASDIDFNPSAPISGATVEISIIVWNNGNANADNVLVYIYDGDPEEQEKLIDSELVDIPEPTGGEDSYEEIIVYWDTRDELGDHDIYIIIDPDDTIDELDETNNDASKTINIQGETDFEIKSSTDIAFSTESPKVGDTVTIQVTIYNEGPESDSVKYKLVDINPETEVEEIISEGSADDIPGNTQNDNYITISVDWTPSEGGDHIIYVELDPDKEITETDEDNNNASRTITVEAEPGEEGLPSWLLPLIAILVVVVIVIIVWLNYKGKKSKPEKELAVAEVVKTEPKKSAKEVKKEEEEEPESLIDTKGGIRIG